MPPFVDTDDKPATEYTREAMESGLDQIVNNARHMSLDYERLKQVAGVLARPTSENWITAYSDAGEHYTPTLPPMPDKNDLELSDEEMLQWSIMSSSQGFLFWERDSTGRVKPLEMEIEGTWHIGGSGVEACFRRAVRSGWNLLDANVLADFTEEDAKRLYRDERTGTIKIQLLERRVGNFRALGRILRDRFDGQFLNVLKAADGYLYKPDGTGLIQIMMTDFRGIFHNDWPVCKRPNVDAFGLYMKRSARNFAPEVDALLNFRDIEKAIPGADYYRPLWLIRTGILRISDEFQKMLSNTELIEPQSDLEAEYRAFTVKACLALANELGGWPEHATEVVLESHAQPYLRCRRCEVGKPGGTDEGVPCSYTKVCAAYSEDNSLMAVQWPLVLGRWY